ncbi:hypothetical protein EVAR_85609_1 [Eumeta japonica]|uniref:Uncharacterized protein n=1 Tax=Eumeta variegata TaxID=151549 RepID=A0A4C1XVG8_EUMVA|nr:hypothetical protein EVAR_85609_1 [Eumeta japonica]
MTVGRAEHKLVRCVQLNLYAYKYPRNNAVIGCIDFDRGPDSDLVLGFADCPYRGFALLPMAVPIEILISVSRFRLSYVLSIKCGFVLGIDHSRNPILDLDSEPGCDSVGVSA